MVQGNQCYKLFVEMREEFRAHSDHSSMNCQQVQVWLRCRLKEGYYLDTLKGSTKAFQVEKTNKQQPRIKKKKVFYLW